MEGLLTAHQVADLLGFKPGTSVDWYEDDKIPGFKIGGQLRFDPTEVDEWLDDHRNGAVPTGIGRVHKSGVHSRVALRQSVRTASQQRHRPDSTRDPLGGHEP
jgi:excisionase family DNA binding protein